MNLHLFHLCEFSIFYRDQRMMMTMGLNVKDERGKLRKCNPWTGEQVQPLLQMNNKINTTCHLANGIINDAIEEKWQSLSLWLSSSWVSPTVASCSCNTAAGYLTRCLGLRFTVSSSVWRHWSSLIMPFHKAKFRQRLCRSGPKMRPRIACNRCKNADCHL